ncbi:MAG: flagellar basal body rod protein FlgB [Pirellulales bacterium]|nr:flagellar basal body rod protein FlgB [Pirellulales bacterium]
MAQSMFDATAIPVTEMAVVFTQTRQQLLASNLANFDTPGYKTRDLSPVRFQKHLREAIRERDTGGAPITLASLRGGRAARDGNHSMLTFLHHDKTDVIVEESVAEMAKNQMLHNTALAIMNNQFRLLQAAISERA